MIYRNTPQWFAAIDRAVGDGQDTYGTTIRERALRSIDELVTWTPRTGRNRLYSMIEARPDWVLSRQRAWGVPLTCFVKKGAQPTDPEHLLRNEEVNARILDAFEAEGADAWYKEGAKERFLTGIVDPAEWDKVDDILDVWFDSGSTHAFVLRDREDGSEDGLADLYLEGTDQHRGWFHSSMLQACGTMGRAPYRGVLTHGFTLDEKGNKMSKSLGNTVAPEDVTRQYGADILRLWVAQSDYTADSADRPRDPQGRGGWLPPAAQHNALHAGGACAFFRGRPRRACGDAGTGALGAAPAGRARRQGADGVCRLRLPGRLPGAVQLRHSRTQRLLFRHPQGRALLRRRHVAPPRRAHRARHPLSPADDLAGTGAGLHHGGGLAGTLSGRGQLGPSAGLSRNAGRLAGHGPRGEMGSGAAGPPGGDCRARGAADRQGDRRFAGGRAGGACRRPRDARGAQIREFR